MAGRTSRCTCGHNKADHVLDIYGDRRTVCWNCKCPRYQRRAKGRAS